MREPVSYVTLLKKTKSGDYNAYNMLCTRFLEYVPLIMDDLAPQIKKSKVDIEDLHQEGYLAVCEAIHQLMEGDSDLLTVKEVSSRVRDSILLHLSTLMIKNDNKRKAEINRDLNMEDSDAFKEYLTNIREESRTRILQDDLSKYGTKKDKSVLDHRYQVTIHAFLSN